MNSANKPTNRNYLDLTPKSIDIGPQPKSYRVTARGIRVLLAASAFLGIGVGIFGSKAVSALVGSNAPTIAQLNKLPQKEVIVAPGDTVDSIIGQVDGNNLNAAVFYGIQVDLASQNEGSYVLHSNQVIMVPEVKK